MRPPADQEFEIVVEEPSGSGQVECSHEGRQVERRQVDLNSDVVRRFNHAFAAGDLDAVMACLTPDCLFESTGPAPDGMRHEGTAAVRACFADFFDANPNSRFVYEQVDVGTHLAVVRWRYAWSADGHVRGVDLLSLDEGLIAAKLSYVKG